MPDSLHQDGLTYEELNWKNWVADQQRDRDQQLRVLAATTAKTGTYMSGGRLKREVKIVFSGIDAVVTKAVTLRRDLAAANPSLCKTDALDVLKAQIDALAYAGILFITGRSETSGFDSGVTRAITGFAREEANAVIDRAKNDIDGIPLALKLIPNKETSGSGSIITVTGNNNIVNLAPLIGDLDASVKVLNESHQTDIAAIVAAMAKAIRETSGIAEESRRAYLEHLTTVSEQAAKPSLQRRIATITSAISGLSSLATTFEKAAPYYHQLIKLLQDHNIFS